MDATVIPGKGPPVPTCPECGAEAPISDCTVGAPFDCSSCRRTVQLVVDGHTFQSSLEVVPEDPRPLEGLPEGVAERLIIRGRLGEGGSGVVYRAFLKGAGHDVAIKFHDHDRGDAELSLANEVDLTSRLNHPNIVRVYFSGSPGTRPFVVYEIVEGQTLDALLSREGRPDLETVFHLAFQLVIALEHCHRAGVIHRDLKPANILVSQNRLKIADFGIGKYLGRQKRTRSGKGKGTGSPAAFKVDPDAVETVEAHSWTGLASDRLVGTPKYMAPEVIRTQGVGTVSDVYAVGLILYEMVTGEHPFETRNLQELFQRQLGETPRDPREIDPRVPPALASLIMDCLEKEPGNRPRNGGELRQRLALAAREAETPEPVTDLTWENPPEVEAYSPAVLVRMMTHSTDALRWSVPAALALLVRYAQLAWRTDGGLPMWLPPALSTIFGLAALFELVFRQRGPDPDDPIVPITVAGIVVAGGFGLVTLFTGIHVLYGWVFASHMFLFLSVLPYLRLASRAAAEESYDRIAVTESTLEVHSLPRDARVHDLDRDQHLGSTPLTVTLPAGTRRLLIEKEGVGARRVLVEIPPGRSSSIHINLVGDRLLIGDSRT